MTDQEYHEDDMFTEGAEMAREELADQINDGYTILIDDEGYPHELALEVLAGMFHVTISEVEASLE